MRDGLTQLIGEHVLDYTLNQRVEASAPFVTASVWNANGSMPEEGHIVYGGLDLSESNDLTALVLASPAHGNLSIHATFWLPEYGLAERARKDRVPYDALARDVSEACHGIRPLFW